jgi:hypothetical protein
MSLLYAAGCAAAAIAGEPARNWLAAQAGLGAMPPVPRLQ